MQTAELILQLLLAVALSGLLVRLLRVPAPFVQIALGIALAWPAVAGIHVALDPSLFLLLFVPPLLFLDGVGAPKRELRELWLPIFALAFGLVFFTVAVIGPVLHWLIPALPLPVAYALAAVLSPTDAVAVSSLIDRERFPRRFMHILEGEALLNDASGLVVFRIAVAAVMLGENFVLNRAYLPFLLVAAGGVLAGFVTVVAIAQAQRFISKLGDIPPEGQVLVHLLLPFGAYLLAEQFHASGILAAVTAGLLFRWAGLYRYTSLAASIQMSVMWGSVSFAFNGMIFLLLGLQLPDIVRKVPPEITAGPAFLQPIAIVIFLTLALIAIRFGWSIINARTRLQIARWRGRRHEYGGWRLSLAFGFAGVRGAITLAGVLSIPLLLPSGAPFPGRDVAVFLAAGTIICSLLFASAALPLLARIIVLPSEDPLAAEERAARVAAGQSAIARIEVTAAQGEASAISQRAEVAERLVQVYRRKIAAAQEEVVTRNEAKAASAIERELRLAAIGAERQTLRKMFDTRKINDETTNRLMQELAIEEAALQLSA